MSREREAGYAILKRQKNHALFQLELNKCTDIPQKDKLLIKAHLVECRTKIISIFQGFSSYKCYKRLQQQLKEYLCVLRCQELPIGAKNANNNLKTITSPHSLKIITQQIRQNPSCSAYFPRKRSLVLDVGLLRQQSQLRNALSPSNIKSKKSNERTADTARTGSIQRHLPKVYSTNKINTENHKRCQQYVEPFCQQQLQSSNFTKLFLINKIKHQRHNKIIRKGIEPPQQNINTHDKQESIFSFEISSKKNDEELNDNLVKLQARKTNGYKQSDKNQVDEGMFYKRIRQVIDCQYQ